MALKDVTWNNARRVRELDVDENAVMKSPAKSVTLELLEARPDPSGDVALRYAPRVA